MAINHKENGDPRHTVADAWNGFHSVPLRKKDRHLSMFTTPGGDTVINVPLRDLYLAVMGTTEDLTSF